MTCASLTILIVSNECGCLKDEEGLRVEVGSTEQESSQRQRRFLCQRVLWCLYEDRGKPLSPIRARRGGSGENRENAHPLNEKSVCRVNSMQTRTLERLI
jgi:hypothetical protein